MVCYNILEIFMNWAYLAGFLDGDGWITVSKNKNCKTTSTTIGFTQLYTRKKCMIKIYKFLIKNKIKCNIYDRKAPSNIHSNGFANMTNIHIREISSQIKFLSETIPFLVIKIDKAKKCYKYLTNKEEKRSATVQPPAGYKKWNKKEIKTLIQMKNNNFTYNNIAKKLNRSSRSIISKYIKTKIPRINKISRD